MIDINKIKEQSFIYRCPVCEIDQDLPWKNNPQNPLIINKDMYLKCKNPRCGFIGSVQGRTRVIKVKKK
jgi:hypothetical protein